MEVAKVSRTWLTSICSLYEEEVTSSQAAS